MTETAKMISIYTPEEKELIFAKLHEERRSKQKKKELHKDKHGSKKVHILENKEFYKILGLGRDYYIKIEDCENRSSRPKILALHHRGFGGLTKTNVLTFGVE